MLIINIIKQYSACVGTIQYSFIYFIDCCDCNLICIDNYKYCISIKLTDAIVYFARMLIVEI